MGDDHKGKCLVPKWLAWITCILLIAAIVLAIVLPLTLGDNDECKDTIEYIEVIKWQEYPLIEPLDIVKLEDPFEDFDVPENVRKMFEQMTDDQKFGQLQQWSFGDKSGLPLLEEPMNLETMIKLARNKQVGSYLNVVDREWIKQIQDAALETDPKIPILFAFDVVHGHRTIFPVNIGMAATWDRDLIAESSEVAAKETAKDGITLTFAPMLDISRDPRWGRISESFGEDPYLTGELGYEFTKGFQDNGVAACIKHFAAYGGAQAGLDYTDASMTTALLHNDYLPAYKKSLIDAKGLTAMPSFNTVDGVPMTASRQMLTDVLRGLWGWTGTLISDYGAERELIAHGVVGVGDGSPNQYYNEGAKASIFAGTDVDMADGFYFNGLKGVMNDKDIFNRTVREYVDLSVKRMLALKHALNLFEAPMGPFTDQEADSFSHCNTEHLDVAQRTAEAAMVLLKNTDQTLPLSNDSGEKKEIKVIGRTANSKPDMLGFWNGEGQSCCPYIVPFFQGIKDKFSGDEFRVSKLGGSMDKIFYGELDEYHDNDGNEISPECPRDDRQRDFPTAEEVSKEPADYIIFVAGEGYMEHGEASSKTDLNLPDLDILKTVAENRHSETKLILVIIGGRQFSIEWEETATVNLKNGDATVTRPAVDAIIHAWSPGTMGGRALANLLAGEIDFSGRMPVTTPRNVGQCPIYYSQLTGGRPGGDGRNKMWQERNGKAFNSVYMDSLTTPLYPFGYGLSYATYTYSNAAISASTVSTKGTLSVSVSISSDVNRETFEVVQLYVKQLLGGNYISPPERRLRGFERVKVPATGSVTVTFELNVWEDFGYFNNELKWVVDPGTFTIYVAKHAEDNSIALNVEIIESD